ncbi:inactive rhomboid protein [Salix suchowensis]|nr:inactive rhomboid protein [Salix suchowensis]
MEQEEQADYATHLLGSPTVPAQVAQPPSFVTLSPFPPISTPSSRRRISSQFTPSRAVPLTRRLARVSLQGRLVDAEEASSAKAIGLSWEAGVAWELFTPAQRFLIVAVIGVAVSESKKNRIINQLKKSVELRDQVLSSMQQKLDDLCDQLSSIKNQAGIKANASFNNSKNIEPPCNDVFGCDKIKFVDCGCWHCDQHHDLLAGLMGSSVVKLSKGDEVLQYKMPFINEVEQEERRMSDLSDWASSVTSAAEMQMNTYAIDQDAINLKRECEEKDRIAELEDIIRRKNTMITRLRKDMMVLEQKVVQLTRLRRPSSSLSVSDGSELPLMVDNVIYDMDSTTSPSSSDSDSSPAKRPQPPAAQIPETPVQSSELGLTESQKSAPAKASSSMVELHKKSISESPLQEISTNNKSIGLPSSRPKQLSDEGNIRKIRRRTQSAIKDASSKKRWF